MSPSERGEHVDPARRRFLGAAAVTMAAAPFGAVAAAPAAPARPVAPFAPIRQIAANGLDIGYVDAGPRGGLPIVLLHGWPYDIHAFADVVPLLAAAGHRVIVPYLRGYGSTRLMSADAPRNGQQATLAADIVALMDALDMPRATIGGFDWGGRTACIIAALWPERCAALVSVSGYLIGSQAANRAPLAPRAELAWWYQFYFATERGLAGYAANRHEFNKLIWQTASPQWAFTDAVYDRSAVAFDNPDHVAIVIHNYRWRLGLAGGDPRYDTAEARLAGRPAITVPAVTLEGDANGAPHPDPASYANRFTGKYRHRLITGGVGHNLPQEAPKAFADGILEAVSLI